jgi:trimethylguanosine synthase
VLPIPGDELFALTAPITPNIAYYLPRNVDVEEVAALARPLDTPENDGEGGAERTREFVEIEEEWVGDKLKAITAYYGDLSDH